MKHLSGPGFRDATGVSRETFDMLLLYVDLLIRWQDHTNLVSRGSLKDCLLYTSPSPRDLSTSRMPSSA